MKQSKYAIPDYWRTKISQDEEFWGGLFENEPINRNSVIISPVILNSYSNQLESAWAVYPNPQSVIGFLKFIYLPTAFIGFIERNVEGHYYFEENLGELLQEFKKYYPDKKDLISKMENFYFKLDDIWENDRTLCLRKITNWTNKFNEHWEETKGVSFSFHIFSSPLETVKFIIDTYEQDLGVPSLEGDLGLTKDEMLAIAGEDIYDNVFMKRRFTEILTNRLQVAF